MRMGMRGERRLLYAMACKLLRAVYEGNREIGRRGGGEDLHTGDRSPAYEGNVYDIRIMRAWVFLLRRTAGFRTGGHALSEARISRRRSIPL